MHIRIFENGSDLRHDAMNNFIGSWELVFRLMKWKKWIWFTYWFRVGLIWPQGGSLQQEPHSGWTSWQTIYYLFHEYFLKSKNKKSSTLPSLYLVKRKLCYNEIFKWYPGLQQFQSRYFHYGRRPIKRFFINFPRVLDDSLFLWLISWIF